MTEIIRHCPDCGLDRPFEFHPSLAGWSSEPWHSPEWHCQVCGAVLLFGDVPAEEPAFAAVHDRVA